MTTKTLYHGTLIDHKNSIKSYGLYPSVGAFVMDAYGSHVEDEELPELVFAADKKGLDKTLNAITAQIAKKLRKSYHEVTDEEIERYGLLAIIKDNYEFSQKPEHGDFEDHPITVERGDFYTEESVGVDKLLTGKNMLNFFKKYGLWPRVDVGDKKTEHRKKMLTQIAAQVNKIIWNRPISEIISSTRELSTDQANELFDYYKWLHSLLEVALEYHVRRNMGEVKKTKKDVLELLRKTYPVIGTRKEIDSVSQMYWRYKRSLDERKKRASVGDLFFANLKIEKENVQRWDDKKLQAGIKYATKRINTLSPRHPDYEKEKNLYAVLTTEAKRRQKSYSYKKLYDDDSSDIYWGM